MRRCHSAETPFGNLRFGGRLGSSLSPASIHPCSSMIMTRETRESADRTLRVGRHCATKLGKGESSQNVKPFIETLRVANPVRQSRASSREASLAWGRATVTAKRRQRDQTL